ncbi:MAG: hypothetical protein P4M08_14970 [Oligoflexia bacterium]|nr:hypothetical protein [Oligoflexia bacterium]
MLNYFSLVALTFGFLSASAYASPTLSTYSYLANMPQSNRTCAEEAGLLAERFASATGLQVTESRCSGNVDLTSNGQHFTIYVLAISYKALGQIAPYQAKFEDTSILSGMDTSQRGAYSSYTDCLADIAFQSRKFTANTGLAAVNAACAPAADSFDADHDYTLILDGFGMPKASLWPYRPFSRELDSATEGAIAALLQARGAVIVKQSQGEFYYYSQYAAGLNRTTIDYFGDTTQCEAQLASIQDVFKSAGATITLAECVPAADELGAGGSMLEILSDVPRIVSSDMGYNSTPDYSSFDACMKDEARVLADEKAQGKPWLGALCVTDWQSPDLSEFKLNFIR